MGDFPGGPVVKTPLPLQEAQVPYLVGQTKILHAAEKKKNLVSEICVRLFKKF